MYNNFKVFNYFKNTLEDALHGVPEIASEPKHPQHQNILEDLKNVDQEQLDKFLEKYSFLSRDNDFKIRKSYLIDNIQKGIAKEKLIALADESIKPQPYNSENLSNLNIEDNNLVSIKDFELFMNGYKVNDKVYNLTPIVNGSNSSYWLSSTISQLVRSQKLNFKIRLDPFIEIPYSEYDPSMYKMTVYGKPLDWERLKTLREEEFGQWINDDILSSCNNTTDYVWRPDDNELHFTCEELPNFDELEFRGSRYFHAILDKQSGNVMHCDGAIRIYTKAELEYRLNFHVRKPEVRKIGKRVKIFQLDENINQETFALLFTNFMVWNHDAINYFNQ